MNGSSSHENIGQVRPPSAAEAPDPVVDTRLARAFVDLADTLVADFDTLDLLHNLATHSVQLLDVQASGIMVTDLRGRLRVVAASSEQAHLLELFELQNDQGPCLDCFRTSRPVVDADLTRAGSRWPHFASAARTAGYLGVHTLPMRLRGDVVGALTLFRDVIGSMSESDLRVGQALADVATIGLLQQRAVRHREQLAEQLQTALHSRVVIEQAKGVLAERHRTSPDEAFTSMRRYARSRGRLLSEVARDVVERTLDIPADGSLSGDGAP